MGCKLRWIDWELLEKNHSPTFWRFLKEPRIVLHIKEMYFIKQKYSEHYALFLRVTLGLFKITVLAETRSMRRCDGVGSIRETVLCLRVQAFVFATWNVERSRSFSQLGKLQVIEKRKRVSLFIILFSSMRSFCCVMYTLQYSTQIWCEPLWEASSWRRYYKDDFFFFLEV